MNHFLINQCKLFWPYVKKNRTLDYMYVESIGRKIQSFINLNISKVEIRSCCKAGKPFIRLRFIPQQTQWWRRQGKPQSCEDGPNDIQSVKTK